jgi:hypothetical protein
MINSVKLHLGIIWLFPEVELKNLFTFATKVIKAEKE